MRITNAKTSMRNIKKKKKKSSRILHKKHVIYKKEKKLKVNPYIGRTKKF